MTERNIFSAIGDASEELDLTGADDDEWLEVEALFRSLGYRYYWLDLYGRPHTARDPKAIQDLVAMPM